MLRSIRKVLKVKEAAWVLLGCLVIAGAGCNTRIEGCLQANAENFDLNAEKPCDGCCTYPSMGLSLSQKWGERNFANSDTLYDIHGAPYKIQDLSYFLSAWKWTDENGATYTVDSVKADCGEGMLVYTPDILVIGTRQFSYTLGTIRESPLMDSVSFTLGLTEDFSCLDPDDPDTPDALTSSSPLWNPQTQQLETLRLILQLDLNSEHLDTLFIDTRIDDQVKHLLDLAPGIDAQLKLTVDYALWFSDADVQDPATFGQSVLSHFEGSIFQTP